MNLHDRAYRKFDECWDTFVNRFPLYRTMKPTLLIVPAKELKAVAGTANSRQNVIKLNDYFLTTETEDMLGDTIPHELSHIVCHWLFPRAKQAHGPEWKRIMRSIFNTEPSRCHNYDIADLKKTGVVKTRTKKRYLYSCDCGEIHSITTNKHNKIEFKGTVYRCNGCKRLIKYTGKYGIIK